MHATASLKWAQRKHPLQNSIRTCRTVIPEHSKATTSQPQTLSQSTSETDCHLDKVREHVPKISLPRVVAWQRPVSEWMKHCTNVYMAKLFFFKCTSTLSLHQFSLCTIMVLQPPWSWALCAQKVLSAEYNCKRGQHQSSDTVLIWCKHHWSSVPCTKLLPPHFLISGTVVCHCTCRLLAVPLFWCPKLERDAVSDACT